MTLEEIRIALGIDLRLKNRAEGVIILKSIWIEQELQKGRLKYHLAKELNITNASVLNICKNAEYYKKITSYNSILQAYLTKNISFITGIEKRKSKYYVPKIKIIKLIEEGLLQPFIARWGYKRIINALRNDNENYLWNKLMPSFTTVDYLELEKLEKNI